MAQLLRLAEVRATAEGSQPPGYRLAARGHLNLGLLGLLSLLALPPAALAFALVTAPRGGPFDPRSGRSSLRTGPLDVALMVVAALLVLPVVHELIHGAVAALVGGRPVYGLGPGVAFCHFREFIGRKQYAAILSAPLLVLSAGGIVTMPLLPPILRGPLLALLVSNASGAVGDLAALAQLVRLPRGALIADTREGFEAYLPELGVEGGQGERGGVG